MTSLASAAHLFFDLDLGKNAKAFYQKRRRALVSKTTGPIVIQGVMQGPSAGNPWAYDDRYCFQDPLLAYLTGINQFPMALILYPDRKEPAVLYLNEYDPHVEFWEGKRFGSENPAAVQWLSDITGLSVVKPLSDFLPDVKSMILDPNGPSQLSGFWYETPKGKPTIRDHHAQFNRQCRRWIKQSNRTIHLHNLSAEHIRTRSILALQDIQAFRCAADKTAHVFSAVATLIPSLNSEQAVLAHLTKETMLQSRFGYSFPPIIAGGERATILHYTQNDQPLNPDSLVLMDFGVRWHHLHADVSRTVPVSGRFNPLQAIVYDIVLAAQKQVEHAVKPGVTIAQLNALCWPFILEKLQTELVDKGGTYALKYDHHPHNVSHLIGYQVHEGDPYRSYRDTPLVPGQVISNEPGLYGSFSCTIEGVAYQETIGVRIEDDLLITQNGCENLTAAIPKEISALEALMRS